MTNSPTEDPLNHQFQYLTRQIKAADSVPTLLTSAFTGLNLIERIVTVLPNPDTAPGTDSDVEQSGPGYETALIEASDAWWALSEAPTLAWPGATTMIADDLHQLVEAIAAFVLVVTEAMLNAASKSSASGDRVACLQAAHHAGRLYAALK